MAEQHAQRSRAQIEADLAAIRARLQSNVEDLVDQVHPANVKRRQMDNVKSFAKGELENAKLQVKTPNGEWRVDRIALAAGAVVGAVVFVVVLRAIVRRGKSE